MNLSNINILAINIYVLFKSKPLRFLSLFIFQWGWPLFRGAQPSLAHHLLCPCFGILLAINFVHFFLENAYSYVLQDSDEYRALQKQCELLIQQLEASTKLETRTIREQSEKYRSEIYLIKTQSESGSASIRFELESSKNEISRLSKIIESMTIELEKIKRENSEVNCTKYRFNFALEIHLNLTISLTWVTRESRFSSKPMVLYL